MDTMNNCSNNVKRCWLEPGLSELTKEEALNCTQARHHAVHCLIHAPTDLIACEGYPASHLVLAINRHDGCFGFPGGFVDPGETLVQCVNREMWEEINLDLSRNACTWDNYLFSVFDKHSKFCLHCFHLAITQSDFDQMERQALDAKHWGTEVLGTARVPLYTMQGGRRGLPMFLQNQFAGCARFELLEGLKRLEILTEEQIITALSA